MSFETILTSLDNGVLTITMNRPERLNAWTYQMGDELREAVEAGNANNDVEAFVLTGAGRGFCAGADLNNVANPSEGSGDANAVFTGAMRALYDSPVPTLASVNGAAAGGGLGLALACDVVVAAESAFFVATFGPRLGIVPDMGATWTLPRMIGRTRALGMTLLGDRISARQAESWGLIWTAVPDNALADTTAELAARLARSSPDAMARIRETVDAASHNDFSAQLDLEMDHQAVLIPQNMQAAAQAFVEKREPAFDSRRRRRES